MRYSIGNKLTAALLISALLCANVATADPEKKTGFRLPKFQCGLKGWVIVLPLLVGLIGAGTHYTLKYRENEIDRLKLPGNLGKYRELTLRQKLDALVELSRSAGSSNRDAAVDRFVKWLETYEKDPKLKEVIGFLNRRGGPLPEEIYDIYNNALGGTPMPSSSKLTDTRTKLDAIQTLLLKGEKNMTEDDWTRFEKLGDTDEETLMLFETVRRLPSLMIPTASSGLDRKPWTELALSKVGPNDTHLVKDLARAYGRINGVYDPFVIAMRAMGPAGIRAALKESGGEFEFEGTGYLLAKAYEKHFAALEPTLREILEKDSDPSIVLSALAMVAHTGKEAKPLASSVRKHLSAKTFSQRARALGTLNEMSEFDTQKDLDPLIEIIKMKDATTNRSDDGGKYLQELIDKIPKWAAEDQKRVIPALRELAKKSATSENSWNKQTAIDTLMEIDKSSPETLDLMVLWAEYTGGKLKELARTSPELREKIAEKISKMEHLHGFPMQFFEEFNFGSKHHLDYLNHPERWMKRPVTAAEQILKLNLDPQIALKALYAEKPSQKPEELHIEAERVHTMLLLDAKNPRTLQHFKDYALRQLPHTPGGGVFFGITRNFKLIPFEPKLAKELRDRANSVVSDRFYADTFEQALKDWENGASK